MIRLEYVRNRCDTVHHHPNLAQTADCLELVWKPFLRLHPDPKCLSKERREGETLEGLIRPPRYRGRSLSLSRKFNSSIATRPAAPSPFDRQMRDFLSVKNPQNAQICRMH